MFPSIIHTRAIALYAVCRGDAVLAVTVMARALQLLDDLPYREYHYEEITRKAVLEYLKCLATKDMKVQGKWN